MSYQVKEIYYTLQGEGANTGRPAVFCRFTGCNLWSGREQDRATAVCRFCDTDFVGTDGPGGGRFDSPQQLANAVAGQWMRGSPQDTQTEFRQPSCRANVKPLVVCTGGEPLLQLDEQAVSALHARGFEVAVETNGTCQPPEGLDWICVSPKVGTELLVKAGHELKLVYPQTGCDPRGFEQMAFQYFWLQPMDSPDLQRNTRLAVEYCLDHPLWRLSLQAHKLIGIR